MCGLANIAMHHEIMLKDTLLKQIYSLKINFMIGIPNAFFVDSDIYTRMKIESRGTNIIKLNLPHLGIVH
jgi:hypothetical protein